MHCVSKSPFIVAQFTFRKPYRNMEKETFDINPRNQKPKDNMSLDMSDTLMNI